MRANNQHSNPATSTTIIRDGVHACVRTCTEIARDARVGGVSYYSVPKRRRKALYIPATVRDRLACTRQERKDALSEA